MTVNLLRASGRQSLLLYRHSIGPRRFVSAVRPTWRIVATSPARDFMTATAAVCSMTSTTTPTARVAATVQSQKSAVCSGRSSVCMPVFTTTTPTLSGGISAWTRMMSAWRSLCITHFQTRSSWPTGWPSATITPTRLARSTCGAICRRRSVRQVWPTRILLLSRRRCTSLSTSRHPGRPVERPLLTKDLACCRLAVTM